MSFHDQIKRAKVVAVVDNGWGDGGKGKIVDVLAPTFDVVARGTGGANAGHTVIVNGKYTIFHLLPSGITYDRDGVVNMLGSGMVIGLDELIAEIGEVEREGGTLNHFMISNNAHVVLPYHRLSDQSENQSMENGGIGSTGKGIGPCYTDKIARRGVRISDLFHEREFIAKVSKALSHYPTFTQTPQELWERCRPQAERIKPFVRDTMSELHALIRDGKRVLLEGAQGFMLSVEYGTYPYVTSSDPSINGTAAGVGISAKSVDICLGIVKFPFMSRVGNGPFPTEFGGERSQLHCARKGYGVLEELQEFEIPYTMNNGKPSYDLNDARIRTLMNSSDSLLQGIGLRLASGEYGATSKRPRRLGWTDAVAVKRALAVNGRNMVLTKVDCVAGMERISIAHAYERDGIRVEDCNTESSFLSSVQPVYRSYEGFSSSLSSVRAYDDLPDGLKQAIHDFEQTTGGSAVMISVGPESDQVVMR